MRASSVFAVLSRRIRQDEEGFSLLEVVAAMGVIFLSMTMLASTALVGFNGAAVARERQTATALAERYVEQVRALPFAAIKEGLKDSDLPDTGYIYSCSGTYEYGSCDGETIVHQAELTYPSTPLNPHRVALGSAEGFPRGGSRAVYVTQVSGSTNVYRLTVLVTWTSGAATKTIQTQTLLSSPIGSGGASSTSGSSLAYFNGSGSASPGSVAVTPNGAVYSGIGVTGLTSSNWNTGDSVTQRLFGMDAQVTQGQLTLASGQSTATSVEKSISGTVTTSPTSPNSTYSSADDDPTTSSIGTSSSPTGFSQSGPSLTMTGSGNSLTMNQYSATTTTTTTTDTISKKSSSYATSDTGNVTVTAPSGMVEADLLLAHLSYQGTCMSTPSGWTLIRCDTKDTGGSAPRVSSAVFWKFATAADVSAGSFSFTTGGTSGTVGGIVAYTGGDGSVPIDNSTAATGSSTTATTPALDVGTPNARLVTFFAAYGNTTITPTDPGTAATDWTQNWSATGGNPRRYYFTSTPALSTTAGSGTIGSGNTNVGCDAVGEPWCVARTFATTVNADLKSGSNSWPLQVSISAADPATDYEYRFYLVHQGAGDTGTTPKAGTSPSGYSQVLTGTGTKSATITWDPGTWAAGDKLAVVWEHHKIGGGGGGKSSTMDTTSASYVNAPTTDPFVAGGATASGNKKPPGQGNLATGWSATLSQSALWVAQMVSIKPGSTTTTTTTNDSGTFGTESGSTTSTVAAAASPVCGSPAQTDGKACAYATQTYPVPVGVDNTFLATTVDFTNSTNGYTGLGTCRLYKFGPPTTSSTSYAYGRRQATSGDGKVREDVKRYYGTHIFGQLCGGTSQKPSGWPGYFVKYDAGTSACQAIAEAGVSATAPSATTCGTISVWNGTGTTSFSPPSSGTWSTNPTAVSYTSQGYKYDMTATLGSGQTFTTSTGSGTLTAGKAVVGSPVVGTITYKLTDTTNSRVLVDVTLTIDLGTLTSTTVYTAAA